MNNLIEAIKIVNCEYTHWWTYPIWQYWIKTRKCAKCGKRQQQLSPGKWGNIIETNFNRN